MDEIGEYKLKIRQYCASDKSKMEDVHTKAFGKQEGPIIADLVVRLLEDKTAAPVLSLVASENEKIIGHILFTKITITQAIQPVTASILAPMAVLPGSQAKGVGSKLIQEGLRRLKQSGVELVFVLGHPDYYPRSGFIPAGTLGYEAPYPIPEENADAWMVQELRTGIIGRVKGKVKCSVVLNQPEYWRE